MTLGKPYVNIASTGKSNKKLENRKTGGNKMSKNETKNLNKAVRVILNEAKELLSCCELDAEKEVVTLLRAAELITISNDLSGDIYNSVYLTKEKIIQELLELHHERICDSFN